MKKIEYFDRNNTLLADGQGYRMPAMKNKVNLNWWHIKYGQKEQNLGDMLSEVVFEYMCKKYNIEIERQISKTKHLYAIGSILFFENQDATIWGTGCMHSLPLNCSSFLHQRIMRKLDVRAVRGPKTREALLKLGVKCPEIYGDPAMLMPMIYKPERTEKKYIVVIPHYKDRVLDENMNSTTEVLFMDMITDNWQTKIDIISSAKFVISSSLHGIILAESYGVPAVLLRPSAESDLFKYEDYYWGTGRKIIPKVNTIKEGVEFDISNIEKPNVEIIQENLIKSFPTDLWKM